MATKSELEKDTFAIYREFQGSNLDVEDLYDYYKKNPNPDLNRLKKLANLKDINEQFDPSLDKKDVTLNINSFNKLEMYDEQLALARMVQNIVITKKGTYPNNPNFGVGIENYLFELATPAMQNEIQYEINEQLGLWLSGLTNFEIQSEVNFMKDTSNPNYNTLAIFFKVIFNNSGKEDKLYKFSLFFAGDTLTKKIVSKLEI